MKLIHQAETHRVIGCLMKVHREVGPGLDEAPYQQACEQVFAREGIQFEAQGSRWIQHRGIRVKELVPDFLVETKFVLDLKVLLGELPPASFAQVFCYCKLIQVSLGFLANFGMQSLAWKRLAYTPQPGEWIPDESARRSETETTVLHALHAVWQMHGLGYTDDIYRLLVKEELRFRGLQFVDAPTVAPRLDGCRLRETGLPVILVENRWPVAVYALHEQMTATQLARMRTYLHCLDASHGWVTNFGKTTAQVTKVNART